MNKMQEKNSTEISKDELNERKDKLINFLKEKKEWIYLLVLAFLIFISAYIRTRNIPLLKDITTGTWTLGPDLDPFLFLRWTKYIIENGSLMSLDPMRYVPLGYDTAGEMVLLPYMMAWFYKFLAFFSNEVTVTYSAILFPVFMFGLAVIAFFLFSRKIFDKEGKQTRNIIALIATTFFILIPSLLPRTIAGIPEKEAASFFFLFIAFYFFLEAISSKNLKKGLTFGILAGISTGLLALIWGGVLFVFFTIPAAVLLSFLFGKIKEKEFLSLAVSPGNFTEVKQMLEYVFRMIDKKVELKEALDAPEHFIEGRTAEIIFNKKRIGFIGEVHPRVLRNWKIKMPVALFEINLDDVLEEFEN